MVGNAIEETIMVDDIMVDHPKVVNQAGPIGSKLAKMASLLGKRLARSLGFLFKII